ncbi:MAG: hypothetical protein ACI8ZB_001939 [Desulforhopalus sp.]|jgi:hypothetical protein
MSAMKHFFMELIVEVDKLFLLVVLFVVVYAKGIGLVNSTHTASDVTDELLLNRCKSNYSSWVANVKKMDHLFIVFLLVVSF